MLKLTRRGKAEPLPLNADDANLAVIEARDEALADAVALRDRCDSLYAASRAKDATLAEAEARGAEALELASSAEADATDLRERLAEVLGVRDAAVAAQSERADRAEAELARVAAALAPLTVTTGMTHAERALAAGVIRDSISLPAVDAGMIA
jgi:hypothetical protein